MTSTTQLKDRIKAIEERDKRVEKDKAWEVSWTRRLVLIICIYLVVGLYLQVINIPDPWPNAIVPSVGFLLTTLTLPLFKSLWLKYIYKKSS